MHYPLRHRVLCRIAVYLRHVNVHCMSGTSAQINDFGVWVNSVGVGDHTNMCCHLMGTNKNVCYKLICNFVHWYCTLLYVISSHKILLFWTTSNHGNIRSYTFVIRTKCTKMWHDACDDPNTCAWSYGADARVEDLNVTFAFESCVWHLSFRNYINFNLIS